MKREVAYPLILGLGVMQGALTGDLLQKPVDVAGLDSLAAVQVVTLISALLLIIAAVEVVFGKEVLPGAFTRPLLITQTVCFCVVILLNAYSLIFGCTHAAS